MSRRKVDPLIVVARNLRRLRNSLELSQEQLADKSGFHRTYVGAIERAERNITIATLAALAEALNTTIIDLLDEKSGNGS